MNDQPDANSDEKILKSFGGTNRRNFDEGQYIFREGETGDLAFVVLSGQVEIVHNSGDDVVQIGTVAIGGMFGEMALIDNKPRMASARAYNGPAETALISQEMFQKKMAAADPFNKALIEILSSHIRSLSSQLAKTGARAS